MNRRLEDEESEGNGEIGSKVSGAVEVSSAGEGAVKPVASGFDKDGVGCAPVEPKGTSVTLHGCGRKDGSDVSNSMSLAGFYRHMFEGRRSGESKLHELPQYRDPVK